MRWILAVTAALLVVRAALPGVASEEAPTRSGFFALNGADASSYVLPPDMQLVTRIDLLPDGLTYERYQQYFGAARVMGAEVSLLKASSGATKSVVGSHYPGIEPRGAPVISAAEAKAMAGHDAPSSAERLASLSIDPEDGRYFFVVESRSFGSRWFHWIDATSGRVLNKYNAIPTGEGTGVKGDTKDLTGLTTFHGGSGHGASGPHYDLASPDGRQQTYDYRNVNPFIYAVTDSDDVWDLVTADRQSPGHPALVDAHYYASLADGYLQEAHGLDWIADCGYTAFKSVAHYGQDYANAFWDGVGEFVVYGDGDGVETREFSGALDVVAHEHAHGVTECTSDLIYQGESGALNESFSDIIGNSVEFFANEQVSSNCVRAEGQSTCADWWIAEDIDLLGDTVPGFRNMADPEEDGDPDHYSEYIVTSGDNGGVHSNSGIPNHAYYLLVNGGLNASCAEPSTHGSAHCSDSDTQDNNLSVTPIGLADAERTFFLGFTALPLDATMCQARASSEAAASALFGPGSQQALSTTDAWVAAGLTDLACGIASPTPTPTWTPTPTSTPTPTATSTPTATATPTPTATATPPADTDGDGVPDTEDNCPTVATAWIVPAGDGDCDAWTDALEGLIGTDASDPCADTSAANDEDPDPQPPDFNDDTLVDVTDLSLMGPPIFNIIQGADENPEYDARFDLNADDFVDITDVALMGPPVFNALVPCSL